MGQEDFYVCELDQDFGLLSQSEPAFTLVGGGPASGGGRGVVGGSAAPALPVSAPTPGPCSTR